MRSRPGFTSDISGGTAVEFALILPLLMTLLMGTVEFGRAMWTRSTLQFGCEEAVRYALVNTGATSTAIKTYATGKMSGISATDPDLTLTATMTSSQVTVSAAYTFRFLVPNLLPFGPLSFNASSQSPL